MKRYFIITMMIGILLTGCSSRDNVLDKIKYEGKTYQIYNGVGLNFNKDEEASAGMERIGTKIGEFKGSEVYSIEGLDQEEWVFLSNPTMLSVLPTGVFYAGEDKMDLSTFGADHIEITRIIPPTSGEEQEDVIVLSTSKEQTVSNITKAIMQGKLLSKEERDKKSELFEKTTQIDNQNAYVAPDGVNYSIAITSNKYPNLSYQLSYMELTDQKYYIQTDVLIDKESTNKIEEIDGTIKDYIEK